MGDVPGAGRFLLGSWPCIFQAVWWVVDELVRDAGGRLLPAKSGRPPRKAYESLEASARDTVVCLMRALSVMVIEEKTRGWW